MNTFTCLYMTNYNHTFTCMYIQFIRKKMKWYFSEKYCNFDCYRIEKDMPCTCDSYLSNIFSFFYLSVKINYTSSIKFQN